VNEKQFVLLSDSLPAVCCTGDCAEQTKEDGTKMTSLVSEDRRSVLSRTQKAVLMTCRLSVSDAMPRCPTNTRSENRFV